jgi:hypothetical protein
MEEQDSIGGSEYQITIALMCRDFLFQIENDPNFRIENDLLDRITSAIIEEGDEDLFHLKNLEAHLNKYESKLISLYSKNPNNSYIDTLYRRTMSLRDMCSDFIRGKII